MAGIASVCKATDYTVDPALPASATNYQTLEAALAGVPSGASESSPNRIIISPGTYANIGTGTFAGDAGATSFSLSHNNIDLIGADGNPADVVITSALEASTISSATGGILTGYNTALEGGTVTGGVYGTGGTTQSATFVCSGQNVSISGVTIANSTDTAYIHATNAFGNGTSSVQAVAYLQNGGDQVSFTNDSLLGYQDTLYLKGGRMYFTNCTVNGDDDFIWAQGEGVVFNNNTINIDGNHSGGCVTAASQATSAATGFVFMNNTFTGNSVQNNPVIDPYGSASFGNAGTPNAGSMYLGRPYGWTQAGGDSAVTYLNNIFNTTAINAAGWLPWNSNETNPAGDTRYAEYGDVLSAGLGGGPEDATPVSWAHALSAAQAAMYTLANIYSFGGSAPGTAASGTFWYNSSLGPSEWGPRNDTGTTNLDGNLGTTAALTAYTNPLWKTNSLSDTTWDPTVQIATDQLPEPSSLAVLGAGVGLLTRRRKM
jgi:pectin methylesterase-like acyl-CoA thioesterase